MRRHGDLDANPFQPAAACGIDNCERPSRGWGMCKSHYEQERRKLSGPPPSSLADCSVPGCVRFAHARTWCPAHYARWRKYGHPESGARYRPPGEPAPACLRCGDEVYARGLCMTCYLKRWRTLNPEDPTRRKVISRRSLLKQYGLMPEDYEQMLAAQEGRCAICPATMPGRGNPSWNVDHDHETGAVRGLLCHNCNMALGMLGDSVDVAKALLSYLLAHSAAGEVVRLWLVVPWPHYGLCAFQAWPQDL